MKSAITVIGSSNTDMVIKLERIPRLGETILGGDFHMAPGGKGANQAVAAARAGGKVTFIARVGSDAFGEQALAGFQKDGLNVSHVLRDAKTPSGVALIFVGRNGENSIAVASGANGKLRPSDVKRSRAAIEGAQVLLMQLETPVDTIGAAARIANRAGVITILNPAPARSLPAGLLADLTILTPNETEAELLTGIKVRGLSAAARAARKLREFGVKTAIITLGSRGAFLSSNGMEALVPGFKVYPIDTTAAGDVFNGALAVALAEGRTMFESVHFANAAAAVSVTRLGAQPSAPRRTEIDRLLKSR